VKPTTLVQLITDAYNNRKGVFATLVNAENHIPQDATKKEKALFLFYIIQLDYAMKSQILYEGAKKLWKKDKKYFKPEEILKKSDEMLRNVIKKYLKPRYINEALLRWKSNSEKILNKYNGNPLKLFEMSKNAKELEQNVREFRGFGPKIGNFFIRAMINTFDFKVDGIEDLYQPVDVHDVRLTLEWGLVQLKIKDEKLKMNTKTIRKVQNIWQEACKEAGVSWLVFDRALWILGSEGKRSDDPVRDLSENLDIPYRKLQKLINHSE